LFDLDFVVDKLRKAYEVIREYEMDRGVVASALGRSEKGGSFTYLLGAWEDYGLTENGEGKAVLTELGKQVIAGEEGGESGGGAER